MRAHERLIEYARYDTASDAKSKACPSTEKQLALADRLVRDLKALGLPDARADRHGYVYASLPANCGERVAVGLIAHMDVVDVVPSHPVKPRLVEYAGGPLTLENGDVLTPEKYPGLRKREGKTLVVTDGRTLLGADDKAGVAEIMTALEALQSDPSILHGPVKVAFTPDEEIGRGADLFDVRGFGAEFAYTVDGGDVGSIEFENFNAASAIIRIHGVSIHPGSAKGRMLNANLVACELSALLPPGETPADTEGYEGFQHLTEITGTVELATMHYILRDHDRQRFEMRKQRMADIAAALNEKYGAGTVELQLVDSYFNMLEVLKDHMHVVRRAEDAYSAAGVEPFHEPIRGGTDGSRLSFMGLPCPNLATGGMNFHSRHELIAVEDMDQMVKTLVELVRARS